MNISPVLAPAQVEEMAQVLILKKAQTIEANQNQALIKSTMLNAPSQPFDPNPVGRVIDQKV